jgi:hypothetical protein
MRNTVYHPRLRVHRPIAPCWLALLCFGMVAVTSCTSDDPVLRALAEGCSLDSDCSGSLVCSFGRCHAACRTSKDCANGGRCVELERGSVCLLEEEAPCSAQKSCAAPLVCAADMQCRTPCTGASACISNQVCAVGGICADTTEVGSDGVLRNAPARDAGGGSGGAPGTGGVGAGGTPGTGGVGAGGISAGGADAQAGGTSAGSGGGGAGGRDGGSGSDGSADAGVLPVCNVVAQSGCGANEKCAWTKDPAIPLAQGKLACVPNGTVGLDAACSYGTGASNHDDCGKALACVNGTCKAICDPAAVSGLSACDATHACAVYVGVFMSTDGSSFAGVCEPACNPLTQRRLTDDAPNCGGTVDTTTSPPQPSRGCYGMPPSMPWPTTFVCSSAGRASNTSDVPCTSGNACAAAIGSPYINGCAPGFLPVLSESQNSSNMICAAVCEPGNTSSAAPANAAGKVGSAYTCPTLGAGGKHECRFWWWFEKPTSPVSPNGNAFGICYDYTKYQFDSNDDQIPDKPQPSCTVLSATGHTYSPTITDTQYWGCEAVTTRPK